jgi:signal transduction histidine kinase
VSITVKEKDILFAGINILLFMFSFTYIILKWLSYDAYLMSQEMAPLETSGIYVLMSFAEMMFVVAITLVAVFDTWWIFRIVRKAYVNYRRENL